MRSHASGFSSWFRTAVIAGLVAAVLPRPATALDPSRRVGDYLLDFWQEDSGLPQKFVYVIYQTRDGYLWIGTRGGLARFDGVRFTVFDDRHRGQLQESEVISLAEDTAGGLWIGTNGGGVSRFHDGRFTTYTTQDGLPSDFVPALAAGHDGALWIGTQKGLVRRDAGGTITRVTEGLPDRRVDALYVDAKGVLWIGTQGGLASLADGRVTSHAALHPETLARRVTALTGDADGALWVAMLGADRSLATYKDGLVTAFDSSETGGGLLGLSIDPQGTIWMVSTHGLVRRRDGRFETLEARASGVGANHMVQTSSLRRTQTVFADREGSVWIGTPTDGVARLRDAVFTTISPREQDGMEERISALFEDSRGTMWLAMDAGGVARRDDGAWTFLDAGAKRSLDTFFEYPAGTMWTGNEEQLYRFEAGAFRPVAGPANLVAAVVDKDGTVWLGSKGEGLLQYRDGLFSDYDSHGEIGEQVRGLALDHRGGLWVAAKDTGVACLRGGQVTRYTGEDGRSVSAAAVYIDADDVVWAATRRGLLRIENGRMTTLTAEHGLVANYYYQIVEDDAGYLWLTHGRGVARVSRRALGEVAAGKARTVECQTFGTESGIKATTMVVPNQPAALKSRDGGLWFATGRGAAVVEPLALMRNHVAPPVWIEELRVDKQVRRADEGAVFPPGEGDVELRYSGLSFIAPERVQFRYRLEGFDTEWVEAGTRRVAYYTNLPPGRYVFRVHACNSDGVWNETGHALTFRLRAHWYQTGFFHVGAAVLAGLAVAAAHRWRVREHRRRERELARRVDEAVSHVKMLRGMLPICAGCKKIRDDKGYWNQMETYIQAHSDVDFSHGMCPDCIARLYPDYDQARRDEKAAH